DDGSDETIQNFKASDFHLVEWREVMHVYPKRTGAGWTTIYSQIQTRLDKLHKVEESTKKYKSSVQYEDHPSRTVLNEPSLGMILFISHQRPDFVSIEDFNELNNEMLYNVQESFFRLHKMDKVLWTMVVL
ncbi:hypothetical protein Tco_0123975, partial [Tanacetum coccineum]